MVRTHVTRCRAAAARTGAGARRATYPPPRHLQLSPRSRLCRADAGYLSARPAPLQLSTVLRLQRHQSLSSGVSQAGGLRFSSLSKPVSNKQLDVLLNEKKAGASFSPPERRLSPAGYTVPPQPPAPLQQKQKSTSCVFSAFFWSSGTVCFLLLVQFR